MEIVLLRHAQAVTASYHPEDPERPLTERGLGDAEILASILFGRLPSRIITSPALRCMQTVEPLARRMSITPVVEEAVAADSALGRSEEFAEALSTGSKSLVLCSHAPNLRRMARAILEQQMVSLLEEELRFGLGGFLVMGFTESLPRRLKALTRYERPWVYANRLFG